MTLSIRLTDPYNEVLLIKNNDEYLSDLKRIDNGKFPKSPEYFSEKLEIFNKLINNDIFRLQSTKFYDLSRQKEKFVEFFIKVKYNNEDFYFQNIWGKYYESYENLEYYDKKANLFTYVIDDIKIPEQNHKKPVLVDYIKTYVENNDLFIKFIFDDYSEFKMLIFKDYLEFTDYLEFNNNLNEIFGQKEIYIHMNMGKQGSIEYNDPYEFRENVFYSDYHIKFKHNGLSNSLIIHLFDNIGKMDYIKVKLTPKKKIKSAI